MKEIKTMERRTLLKSAAGAAAVLAVPSLVRAAAPLKELRLD